MSMFSCMLAVFASLKIDVDELQGANIRSARPGLQIDRRIRGAVFF